MKPKAPCQYCMDRHPNCHSECELYSTFRKETDEYNKKRQDALKLNHALNEIERIRLYRIKHNGRDIHGRKYN